MLKLWCKCWGLLFALWSALVSSFHPARSVECRQWHSQVSSAKVIRMTIWRGSCKAYVQWLEWWQNVLNNIKHLWFQANSDWIILNCMIKTCTDYGYMKLIELTSGSAEHLTKAPRPRAPNRPQGCSTFGEPQTLTTIQIEQLGEAKFIPHRFPMFFFFLTKLGARRLIQYFLQELRAWPREQKDVCWCIAIAVMKSVAWALLFAPLP